VKTRILYTDSLQVPQRSTSNSYSEYETPLLEKPRWYIPFTNFPPWVPFFDRVSRSGLDLEEKKKAYDDYDLGHSHGLVPRISHRCSLCNIKISFCVRYYALSRIGTYIFKYLMVILLLLMLLGCRRGRIGLPFTV
jgi:hypothetical protein